MASLRFCQAGVPQNDTGQNKSPKENIEKIHSQAQEIPRGMESYPTTMFEGQAVSF